MLKKTLLVGAVALGLSGAAFGMGDVMPSCPAETFNPGFILGLQAGYGMTNWDNANDLGTVGSVITPSFAVITNVYQTFRKPSTIVGRVYAGYDFHKYFGVELGYMRFLQKTTLDVNANAIIIDPATQRVYAVGGVLASAGITTQAVDLLAKIKAPINDAFGVYAKIGPDLMMTSMDNGGGNTSHLNIAFGVGVNYNITSNFAADLSWMRYQGHERAASAVYQPNNDLFLLGISYKFTL